VGLVGWMGCGSAAEAPDGADVAQEDDAREPPAQVSPESDMGLAVSALDSAWTADLRYAPEADATVAANAPGTPLGTDIRLTVDGDPARRAYLRFRLQGLRGRVARATLRLFAKDAMAAGMKVYVAGSDWREGTLHWDNAPAPTGEPVAVAGAVADEAWLELDVSAAIRGDGDLTLVLTSDATDGGVFVSRESGHYMNTPQLLVSLDVDEPCLVGGAPPVVPGESCAYRGNGVAGTTAGWFAVGGSGSELLSAVGALGSDLVVAGEYSTPYDTVADFGGEPLPGTNGFAVARLGPDGTHVWSRGFPSRLPDGPRVRFASLEDADVSRSGTIALLGSYEGQPDFGAGPLPPGTAHQQALFLMQLGPDGQTRWSRGFQAVRAPGDSRPMTLWPHAIATEPSGDITVLGTFAGAVDLGGGWLVSAATVSPENDFPPRALFLARFSRDGQHVWSRKMGFVPGLESPYVTPINPPALAVDAAGNVIVGGSLIPGTDLGGGHAPGLVWHTPFVVRYSARGEWQWERLLTGAGGGVTAVATAGNRVYFSGNFLRRIRFAGEEYFKDVSYAPFVGAVDAGGEDVWLRTLGYTSPNDARQAMTVDAEGNVVFTNRIGQDRSAGGGVLRAGRLVASYGPDGEHRWSRTLSVNVWDSQLTRLESGELLLGSTMARSGTVEGTTYSPGSRNLVLMRLRP
ncbi:DNRLRE domain-containing protein, partial [Pyxidicoccus fallax]